MFSSISTISLDKIERKNIEFYLKDFLPMPKHTVGMLASRGGMGKTFLSLQVASKFVEETGKDALVWFSEDEPEIIAFRFDKLAESFGISKDTQRKIHYITSSPMQFAVKERGGFKANYEAIAELRKDCIRNNIGLVVIDPLLAFYGGDENDNSQARVFMQVFLEWAKQDGINILFVHHGKKESGEVRGATAFVDAVRYCYELHYPTDDQGNIDFDKKDMGYRIVRLTKDNHNVFFHFSKLFDGNGEGEMRILPRSTEPTVVYQDGNGRYTGAPQAAEEVEYKVDYDEFKIDMPVLEDTPERDSVSISIASHNDAKNPKGFEKREVAWDELVDVMSMGRAYSPSFFRDGHRSSSNYIGGNEVVFLDIDDGMTLDEAKELFDPLQAIIVTTKSHRKEKNGVVADRFRVVIALDEPMDLDASEYRDAMDAIFEYYGSVADKATKDPARFFFSSPDECDVHYTSGKQKFEWRDVYEKAKRIKAIDAEQRRKAAMPRFEDSTIDDAANALSKIDPDCDYDTWVQIGMALQSEFGDAGFEVWDAWSRRGSKYNEREMAGKWKSFNGHGVGIGTLFHHAKGAA